MTSRVGVQALADAFGLAGGFVVGLTVVVVVVVVGVGESVVGLGDGDAVVATAIGVGLVLAVGETDAAASVVAVFFGDPMKLPTIARTMKIPRKPVQAMSAPFALGFMRRGGRGAPHIGG